MNAQTNDSEFFSSSAMYLPLRLCIRVQKNISHFAYLRAYIGCGVSARMDASRQQKTMEFDRNYTSTRCAIRETRGLAKK